MKSVVTRKWPSQRREVSISAIKVAALTPPSSKVSKSLRAVVVLLVEDERRRFRSTFAYGGQDVVQTPRSRFCRCLASGL